MEVCLLRGVNEINLDSKGRVAIPTRYRQILADNCDSKLVVTVDEDYCLLIYPLNEWELIERKLVKLPSFNKTARRLQRLLIGHATDVEMDGNGRLLVPPLLREFAQMDKRVVLIGQGNKFELWDAERWEGNRKDWLEEEQGEDGLPEQLESFSL